MFFILFNLIGTFALTLTEPHLYITGFMNLLFEQVSAPAPSDSVPASPPKSAQWAGASPSPAW